MATYPIRGISVDDGQPIPLRKEITSWYNDEGNALQVSLFITALRDFQRMDWSDPLSYFQIAGIHGQPKQPWDMEPAGKYYFGYCTHNITTFSTWHRPYLLLFEQRLYEIMCVIIKEKVPHDLKPVWQKAADTWRLPYWDWAMPQPYLDNKCGVPEIVTLPEIWIVRPENPGVPDAKKEPFPNPLYKYTIVGAETMGDSSLGNFAITDPMWKQCKGTSRYGIFHDELTTEEIDGVENNTLVATALQNPNWDPDPTKPPSHVSGSIAHNVYRLLSEDYFTHWANFATTEYLDRETAPNFLSLEFIHNNIHNWTGGSDTPTGTGHMCDPAVSAFDPIFWLHHCNIDRLLAIWQNLYKSSWFKDSPKPDDPTAGDPLQPFHNDRKGTHITSDMVRHCTDLGYDYDLSVPKDPKLSHESQATVSSHTPRGLVNAPDLKKVINNLYGGIRNETLQADMEGLNNDYIINVLYNRYALQGDAYTIHFFLGDAPPVKEYHSSDRHVGSVYTFSSRFELEDGASTSCQNCRKQQAKGVLSTGQVLITHKLIHKAASDEVHDISSLKKQSVREYLERHLNWKVINNKGEELPIERFPDLKIVVMVGKADHADDDTQLSRFYNYAPMWSVTEGKLGGARPEDRIVSEEEAARAI